MRRVLRYLADWKAPLAGSTLFFAGQAALGLVPAFLVRTLTAEVLARHVRFGYLAGLVGLALLAAFAAAAVGAFGVLVVTRVVMDATCRLRQETFDHLVVQTVEFHTTVRSGEMASRLITDVNGIEDGLTTLAPALMRGAVSAVAGLAVMLVFSWKLTLVTLVAFPLMALGFRLAGRSVYRARSAVQRQFAELAAFAEERLGLSGFMLVKAFDQASTVSQTFRERNEELRRRQLAVASTNVTLSALGECLLVIGPTTLILAGAYLIVHHELSFASFVAFSAVVGAYFGPALQALISGAAVMLGGTALWARVFEVLDDSPAIVERPDAVELPEPRGRVELSNVRFSYGSQRRPALDDINLRIEPGQLVALVGPSGAGKTTLVSLVARLVDPQSGTVAIDGHDVRALTLSSLARTIGVVFQDSFLFHSSIRENVLLGRPDATHEEVAAALRDVLLEDLVRSIPDGDATVVGERGHRLSGGEKQRVALARVVLKNPPILILDEATAHLDSGSEQLVQAALARVFRGRTSLVIAHRLSTILAADLIVVLDGGRIVERGTHEELLRADGLYARLYAHQRGALTDASGMP